MMKVILVDGAPLTFQLEHDLPDDRDALWRALASQLDASAMTVDFAADKAAITIVARDHGHPTVSENVAESKARAREAWVNAIKSRPQIQPVG